MTRILASLLSAYHALVSPFLPASCRFHPTCSVYAAESLRRHGLWRGVLLAGRRLLRCHPFTAGGLDPVPEPRPAAEA
ncbi:MAG: membrane protein insertion efficiency factor YidD [Myxococcales bacterium]